MDDFLIYLGYAVLFCNLIFYSISFFRKEKANIFFVLYIVFCSFMQFSMEIMYHLKLDNLFVMNMFFIGQMILLGLFYNSVLKLKPQKIFIKCSIVSALLLFVIQFCIDPAQFFKFNLFVITVSSLFVVVFALLHFYNILTEYKNYYYITIGIVIYLLASTILFLVGNLTKDLSNDLKYLSWTFNAFLLIIYQLFIFYEWKVSFYDKRNIKD